MMITIVTQSDLINQDEWRLFIQNHPKGSVFQTPEMFDCYVQTPGCIPMLFAAYSDKALCGVLVATILKENGRIKSHFSTRSIIQSGPIVKDDNSFILESLLKEYSRTIPRDVIYTQIRNQFDWLHCCDSFRKYGFVYEPHLDFLIHLDTEEDMWSRIGRGRRQQIRKAQKNGLFVKTFIDECLTEDLIEDGYKSISEVYRRANLPLVDIKQIDAARRNHILCLFVVYTSDGSVAGGRFALRFGKTLYGWYAGSYQKYLHLFPNDILIWETIKWAMQNGFTVFDYGGAGSPNKEYGVRNYKSQLGGELVNWGRFEKKHKPFMFFIAKHLYSFYRKFFSFR